MTTNINHSHSHLQEIYSDQMIYDGKNTQFIAKWDQEKEQIITVVKLNHEMFAQKMDGWIT